MAKLEPIIDLEEFFGYPVNSCHIHDIETSDYSFRFTYKDLSFISLCNDDGSIDNNISRNNKRITGSTCRAGNRSTFTNMRNLLIIKSKTPESFYSDNGQYWVYDDNYCFVYKSQYMGLNRIYTALTLKSIYSEDVYVSLVSEDFHQYYILVFQDGTEINLDKIEDKPLENFLNSIESLIN